MTETMTLGEQLHEVRGVRDMTLKAVADAADLDCLPTKT